MNHLDHTLRSLDAAAPVVELSDRARADLDRIVATAPAATAIHRPRRRGRLVLAGIAAASIGAGLVLTPGLFTTQTAKSGAAAWSAVPSALSERAGAPAIERCRTMGRVSDDDRSGVHVDAEGNRTQIPPGGLMPGMPDLSKADVVLTERRGDMALVILATDGMAAECLISLNGNWMAGGVGSLPTTPPTGREIVAASVGTLGVAGALSSMATGFVGPEIAEISAQTKAYGTVVATVTDGYFGLWLPNDELDPTDTGRTELTVTYRDGTSETRVVTAR